MIKASNQFQTDYPFGNPNPQPLDDTQSYHSIQNDQQKQNYFQQPNLKSQSKLSQRNRKPKSQLPPTYPYEQMKKLKESLKLLKTSSFDNLDSKSVHILDSFTTANQFKSICYQEGDFQNMINGIVNQNLEPIQGKSQDNICNQNASFQSIGYTSIKNQQNFLPQQKQTTNNSNNANKKLQIKQSSILDISQNQDLEDSKQNQFERFTENQIVFPNEIAIPNGFSKNKKLSSAEKESYRTLQKQEKYDAKQYPRNYQDDKSVEISHIDQILNQSENIDNEILQLTQQLQKIQSSHYQISQNQRISQDDRKKHKQLGQKCLRIQNRLRQLQQIQQNFSSQILFFSEKMKKTEHNNSYLKKQVQFFQQKSNKLSQKQEQISQKQKKLKERQMNTSKNNSFSLSESRIKKPKTFNIKPKAPNNQSKQSKKYKQLTFQFCQKDEGRFTQEWKQLQTDSSNTPPQYQLLYSFQQNHSLFVIRIVDLINNEASRYSLNSQNKRSTMSVSSVKKNYQYLMDFADNQYESSQKKLQSLSRQLIVHLEGETYKCKQFTKKIQIFLMINEQETYIDLIRVVPLPNPLVFYIQKRFDGLIYGKSDNHVAKAMKNGQNQNQLKKLQTSFPSTIQKNLASIYRFMKTYVIRIEHMADIESIQKLMNLGWINSAGSQQTAYFSIKSHFNPNKISNTNQLFYVKIQNCILESQKSQLDQKCRYSLTFKVASTIDNELLIDLIEFLTFLTVM